MDKNIVTRNLEVSLTAVEVAAYAQTLAIETENRNDLKREAKKVAKVYKNNIDEKESEIVILAAVVRTEKELREVDCRWDFDWDRNTKILTRLDTFEKVEERVIEKQERQLYLEGIEKAEKEMAAEFAEAEAHNDEVTKMHESAGNA